MTQVSDGNNLVHHIANYGYHPVNIEKGQVLGTLEPVKPVMVDCIVDSLKPASVTNGCIELLFRLHMEGILSESQSTVHKEILEG